jgi:hypothetical protein
LQKRIAGSLASPHAGQMRASDAPQPPQKRAPDGFSTPQFAQAATFKA